MNFSLEQSINETGKFTINIHGEPPTINTLDPVEIIKDENLIFKGKIDRINYNFDGSPRLTLEGRDLGAELSWKIHPPQTWSNVQMKDIISDILSGTTLK